MSGSTLYDDDVLLWSEQQAAAIRKLGATVRNLPNKLDIENVAEEIESVGRSELAAVKSYLRLIFVHLIRLARETDSQAAGRWRIEIVGFHSDMLDRYAPSMRQRIEMDKAWRSVRKQLILTHDSAEQQFVAALPEGCPFSLDEVMAEHFDAFVLLDRLRQ